jgi:hypothetical protein
VYAIGLWGDRPYVRIFCRGMLLEGLGISVIKQAVHGHWAGVAISVFLLRYAASATTGQRINAHDNGWHKWDWWYALGSASGALAAIYVTHLIYHPHDEYSLGAALARTGEAIVVIMGR